MDILSNQVGPPHITIFVSALTTFAFGDIALSILRDASRDQKRVKSASDSQRRTPHKIKAKVKMKARVKPSAPVAATVPDASLTQHVTHRHAANAPENRSKAA